MTYAVNMDKIAFIIIQFILSNHQIHLSENLGVALLGPATRTGGKT